MYFKYFTFISAIAVIFRLPKTAEDQAVLFALRYSFMNHIRGMQMIKWGGDERKTCERGNGQSDTVIHVYESENSLPGRC